MVRNVIQHLFNIYSPTAFRLLTLEHFLTSSSIKFRNLFFFMPKSRSRVSGLSGLCGPPLNATLVALAVAVAVSRVSRSLKTSRPRRGRDVEMSRCLTSVSTGRRNTVFGETWRLNSKHRMSKLSDQGPDAARPATRIRIRIKLKCPKSSKSSKSSIKLKQTQSE